MLRAVFIGSFPLGGMILQDLFEVANVVGVYLHNNPYAYFPKEKIQCPIFSSDRKILSTQLPFFLEEKKVDLVVVCGLSYKIPENVLRIPSYGFINVHPGKLPENRGADPIFWSLKNADKETAITIHKMDTNFDTGDIIVSKNIPVVLGETYGILASKIVLGSKGLLKEAIQKIDSQFFEKQSIKNVTYNLKPQGESLFVDWEKQTADEIEFLVNACNPKYGGATTYYQGGEIKLLEVAQVSGQQPLFGKNAGEIIHAHPIEGLYVVCKYGQLLRLKVMSSDAGVLSGEKYVNIGMRIGQKLTTQKQQNIEKITL